MYKILFNRIKYDAQRLASPLCMSLVFFLVVACSSTPAEEPVQQTAAPSYDDMDGPALARLGEGFERSGNLANAKRFFERSLSADPKNLKAQVGLARVKLVMGDLEGGFRDLDRLYTLYPDTLAVAQALTQALVAIKDYDNARDVIGRWGRDPSATGPVLALAGRVFELSGDTAASRSFFERRLSMSPAALDPKVDLAVSFALDGAFATAKALIQPYLGQGNSNATALRALAMIRALEGDKMAAIDIYATAASASDINKFQLIVDLLGGLGRQGRAALLYFEQMP